MKLPWYVQQAFSEILKKNLTTLSYKDLFLRSVIKIYDCQLGITQKAT